MRDETSPFPSPSLSRGYLKQRSVTAVQRSVIAMRQYTSSEATRRQCRTHVSMTLQYGMGTWERRRAVAARTGFGHDLRVHGGLHELAVWREVQQRVHDLAQHVLRVELVLFGFGHLGGRRGKVTGETLGTKAGNCDPAAPSRHHTPAHASPPLPPPPPA